LVENSTSKIPAIARKTSPVLKEVTRVSGQFLVVSAQGDLYAGGWFKGVLAGLQITGDPSGFLLRYSLEGDLVR